MSRDSIDRLAMYTALLVYLAVWVGAAMLLLGEHGWYIGIIVGGVYVLGHVVSISTTGHCYLSADSQALPLAGLTAVILGVVLWMKGIMPEAVSPLKYFQAFSLAFIVGHILAIIYSIIFNGVFLLLSEFKPIYRLLSVVFPKQSNTSSDPFRHKGLSALSDTEKRIKQDEKV